MLKNVKYDVDIQDLKYIYYIVYMYYNVHLTGIIITFHKNYCNTIVFT